MNYREPFLESPEQPVVKNNYMNHSLCKAVILTCPQDKLSFTLRNVFAFKTHSGLSCPRWTQNISGLLINAHQVLSCLPQTTNCSVKKVLKVFKLSEVRMLLDITRTYMYSQVT